MARIALFQMQSGSEVSENLIKSIEAIKEAAENGADLILFPEVHLTEFFPQYPGADAGRYAVGIDSDIVRQFCSVCRKYRIMAVPNIYLNEDGKYYDASILNVCSSTVKKLHSTNAAVLRAGLLHAVRRGLRGIRYRYRKDRHRCLL